MGLINKGLCVVALFVINTFLFTANATEKNEKSVTKKAAKVNQVQIENPVTLPAAEVNKLREALKKSHVKYTDYMNILKQHRLKAKDMEIVRTPNQARARTNIRSQNSQWNGAYDCNDMNASVKPGQVEACDGIDNNCNGDIDEGVTADLFLDADGDGWGDSSKPIKACHIEAGYSARGNDCDDRNIQIYPGAADVSGDGVDANCDGNDG